MKQYLPKKPIKRGFKVWALADSNNGYFMDMQVYVGKENATTDHGLGERVVLHLTAPFHGRNHRIFCDNYFSSPCLFRELLNRGTYACGTVRSTRQGYPEALRGISLSRGQYVVRQSENLTATVWQDRKQVSVLSTMTQPKDTQQVVRRQKDGSTITLPCPTAITTYNKNMNGVDIGDQLRKAYSVRLKCKKNYKYIFWFMFDVCITNAFIMSKFCITVPTSLEQTRLKEFRVSLAKALIGDYCSRLRIGRPSSRVPQLPVAGLTSPCHFPRHQPRARCVYCRYHRNPPCRRESVWQCTDCEGCPTLCLTGLADDSDCWRLWHTQQ